MKGLPQLILSVLFLAACQTLPTNKPEAGSPTVVCPAPFLKEQYRLVHAIDINMAGETRGGIIGVTVADPANRYISCAIMTVEGMVLLEAEANTALKIIRAMPPFDSAAFAGNLIADIKLLFFAPEGELQMKGTLPDGSSFCRWHNEGRGWIDVIARQPEGFEINKYDAGGSLTRQVKLGSGAKNVYAHIRLTATELFDYSLIMTLIEAEPRDAELKTEGPER
jgi:hypothetical protein